MRKLFSSVQDPWTKVYYLWLLSQKLFHVIQDSIKDTTADVLKV